MNISDVGLDLIKTHEGCKLVAYPDPGSGGDPWTVGYGHTGNDVVEGLHISQDEADDYLRHDLAWVEKCINNSVKVELTQGEFDALCSFVYNLGCGTLGKSMLLAKLNAGDSDGASSEFLKFTHAGGKVLQGLVVRRKAEMEVFQA